MQFTLTGTGIAISNQLRAYAEYRFFTSIARYALDVGTVQMTLRQDGGAYFCTAAIDLVRSEALTIQASARHPNAAVDQVAERAGRLLSRNKDQPVSP